MRRLTARQQAFVDAYLAGKTPSEAYREAYSADGMSAATVATEAQRVLKSPHVSPIVEEAKRDAIKRSSWSRQLAIERVRKVNDVTFDALCDGDLSKSAMDGFFGSERRLGELCDIAFEQRLRREAIEHEVGGMGVGFNLHPTWGQVREVIHNADDTEAS